MANVVLALLIIIFSCATNAFALGNPTNGQSKSQVCVACHGVDGNSVTPIWPKIGGLSESYLLEQLVEFKKGPQGNRYDPSMYGIVQNFSQQDLEDLAAYYSQQAMALGTANQGMVALGQQIYRGGNLLTGVPACAACHAADGGGNYLANFPRLSGQNSGYISAELSKFKTKERKNDPSSIMQDIAARLSNEEIEAVANYVAGLH